VVTGTGWSSRASQRSDGPGPVASAFAQLGVAFALLNVGTLVTAVAGGSRVGTVAAAIVLTAITFAIGFVVGRDGGELPAKVADLCWAFSVGYAGTAVFAISAPSAYYHAIRERSTDPSIAVHITSAHVLTAAGVATIYAVALYLARRRVWVQTATVVAVVTLLLAALSTYDGIPDLAVGLCLTVVALYLVLAAIVGLFRPVGSGYVLAALVGGAGAWVLVDANRALAAFVIVTLLVAVFIGAVIERRPPLLSAGGVMAFVLLPRVLVPDLGARLGIGLAIAGSGAAVAFATTSLTARVLGPRPRVGGLLAVATIGALIGLSILSFGHPDAGQVFGFVCVAVVCMAAAAAQRWWAVVLTGLALLVTGSSLAKALTNSPAGSAAILVGGGVAVAAVAIARDRSRSKGPTEEWRHLREVSFGASYLRVFPALQSSAEQLQLRVAMADHTGGRLLLADRSGPRLDIRLRGTDFDTTLAIGARTPHDAETNQLVDALLQRTVVLVGDLNLAPMPRPGR
jgi:hypothetical protein